MSKIQIVVNHLNDTTSYHSVGRSWRIDAASRCIVIVSDTVDKMPRKYIPLDNVVSFSVERIPSP